MSAVSTLPYHITLAREYYCILDVLQQLAIALLMVLLDSPHLFKFLGNLVKAFFTSLLSHASIHISPFEVLTVSRIRQIRFSVTHATAIQILIPHLSMLFLVSCRLLENRCYLHVTILLSLRSKVSVFITSHTLTSKSLLEVLLGLCSLQFFHSS